MNPEERVAIVTDSASYNIDNNIGVSVVPVVSIFDGDEVVPDGTMSTEAFYEKMNNHEQLPTTAAPAPATFREIYERISDDGTTEILSIHITNQLSATYRNAQLATNELPEGVRVDVFDSKQISAATGLSVDIAAELAAKGWSIQAIREYLESITDDIGLIAALDTTEHARKGGRIGNVMNTLATILNIKPILRTDDGRIEIVGKSRTMKKAKGKMIQTVRDETNEKGKEVKRIVVIHTNAPQQAETFRQEIEAAFGDQIEIKIAEAGNALGVQVGEGALGFAWLLEEI